MNIFVCVCVSTCGRAIFLLYFILFYFFEGNSKRTLPCESYCKLWKSFLIKNNDEILNDFFFFSLRKHCGDEYLQTSKVEDLYSSTGILIFIKSLLTTLRLKCVTQTHTHKHREVMERRGRRIKYWILDYI